VEKDFFKIKPESFVKEKSNDEILKKYLNSDQLELVYSDGTTWFM